MLARAIAQPARKPQLAAPSARSVRRAGDDLPIGRGIGIDKDQACKAGALTELRMEQPAAQGPITHADMAQHPERVRTAARSGKAGPEKPAKLYGRREEVAGRYEDRAVGLVPELLMVGKSQQLGPALRPPAQHGSEIEPLRAGAIGIGTVIDAKPSGKAEAFAIERNAGVNLKTARSKAVA